MTTDRPASGAALRDAPIEMSPSEFRRVGHHLVDALAAFLESLPTRRVAPGETPAAVRALLPATGLPEHGADAQALLDDALQILQDHSTFNGHPRFFGYITAPPAPLGALADLLAAMINPNAGGWVLAPAATEIEKQTVRWLAELIGYPASCGGLLVSGGNAANLVAFLAARAARLPWNATREGSLPPGESRRPMAYVSREAHTWIEKAAAISGLGTDAVRWIAIDAEERLDVAALRVAVEADRAAGALPFLVVGTAGTTGTGAIDPLADIAGFCREQGLWFHVDGAYGAPVATLPDAPSDLRALAAADSIAVDPHKWLYAPLEAGCVLVRDEAALRQAFSFHPSYYHFDGEAADPTTNYYEYGIQNSRGFRALKVWLTLRQVGRAGYARMIADDIALANRMAEAISARPDYLLHACRLSIVTFAYVPPDLRPRLATERAVGEYVDRLNGALVTRLQAEGRVFLSNAVAGGRFLLRACIVNFRTSAADVDAVPGIVAEAGRRTDGELRPHALR